jgi:hypothetical protein
VIALGVHFIGIEIFALALVVEEVPTPHAMEELPSEAFLESGKRAHRVALVLTGGNPEQIVAGAPP